jgi:hypothetical protein
VAGLAQAHGAVGSEKAAKRAARLCRLHDIRNGNFYLAGATKEALKDTPEFQYSKVQAPPKPRKMQAQ